MPVAFTLLYAIVIHVSTTGATGAGCMLAQAIATAQAAGASGQVLCRADSAYYGWAFAGTALRHKAWFSITARSNASINRAITGIEETAWTPIEYPHAIWDEEEHRWMSDAQVAETLYTAFTSRRKGEHVDCRLVGRRVKRLQAAAPDGSEQGELFTAWRYHAFITNSTLSTIEADQRHREHAVVEQVIAELKDGPLAHLPSGSYAANAAWAALSVTAFNIARAAAAAAAMATARWATLRRRVISVPARIASRARHLILHLPAQVPCTWHCRGRRCRSVTNTAGVCTDLSEGVEEGAAVTAPGWTPTPDAVAATARRAATAGTD